MAKAYRDGKGWSIRLRYKRQEVYLSGFATSAAAEKAANEKKRAIDSVGKPKGLGPWRTSVAQAFQDYARERLPSLNGAAQDARRINRYLRGSNLDLVQVTQLDDPAGARFSVALVPCPATRRIVPSLRSHRAARSARTQHSERLRDKLARTPVAEVTAHQVQELLDAMLNEEYEVATVAQERSLLRVLFNYARHTWYWPEPVTNPASRRKLPKIDNRRDRVISNDEFDRISSALRRRRTNRYVAPAIALLLATTMRVSEALFTACWQDIDLDRCVLRLRRGKAGWREVPLGPEAMAILRQLMEREEAREPQARILPITYEALKAAWNKACASAGVEDAHIHDLRHTGATRYALEYQGNVPVLKAITGHKTDAMLNRYVHIRADDVVRLMHGRPASDGNAPAGLSAEKLASLFEPAPLPDNVIRLATAKRRAA